jgi:Fe-S cluster biogenesis protein NfuA
MAMKKKLNEKLNAKVTKVLMKDLDDKALDSVTGGSTTVVGTGGCRTCGILVTTGT